MSCNRSWRRNLALLFSNFVLFPFVKDMTSWTYPVRKLPSKVQVHVVQCCNARACKKIYVNFAYIFIGNIRLFFGRTVSSSDVRSTHIKYWENPIFLSHFRVFFFACTFWWNSYVLNLSDISDIFISTQHIFLSDTSICSYPRIVLIRGPTLIVRNV